MVIDEITAREAEGVGVLFTVLQVVSSEGDFAWQFLAPFHIAAGSRWLRLLRCVAGCQEMYATGRSSLASIGEAR